MTDLPSPRRKAVPATVQVQVLLRMLGLKGKKINWSHEPALELRAINEAGTDWDPPQHDPDFIFARTKEDHDRLTFKDNGTGRGDLPAIAHSRRVTRKQEEHVRRMQAKLGMNPAPAAKRKSNWSKGRKLQSRGFERRRER